MSDSAAAFVPTKMRTGPRAKQLSRLLHSHSSRARTSFTMTGTCRTSALACRSKRGGEEKEEKASRRKGENESKQKRETRQLSMHGPSRAHVLHDYRDEHLHWPDGKRGGRKGKGRETHQGVQRRFSWGSENTRSYFLFYSSLFLLFFPSSRPLGSHHHIIIPLPRVQC